jgi:hypothetical protein
MATQTEILAFVETLNAKLAEYNTAQGFKWQTIIEPIFGKKYAKLAKSENHGGNIVGRSAYCFINIETGDILKAASWAAPAKGVRGNIAKGLGGLTPYGAIYFK